MQSLAFTAAPCRPSPQAARSGSQGAAAPVAVRRAAAAVRTSRRASVRVCAAASESVKGYPGWEEIFRQLAAAKTRSVSPEEAFDMSEMGQAVLIDVRPREDYEKAHPKGAISVPAFIVIDSFGTAGEFAKWLACKANGVTPTKPNPALAAEVAAAAGSGKAVILACEAGGTLQPSVNFPQGKVSRSLKAAWKVVASEGMPADRVLHLDGGVYRYAAAGMPMTGEYDGSNAGRTPNVAEKPTGTYFDNKQQ